MPNAPRRYRPAGYTTRQHDRDRSKQAHRKLYNRRAYRDSFDEHMHATEPLCVRCEKAGRATLATEKHHKRKLRDHPEDLLDPEQVEHLCKACHDAATARGE
jgi:5-methylcytosine-specific restriction endonuclease McrA